MKTRKLPREYTANPQPKLAHARSALQPKRPTAPPAYRPQPMPRVLQKKTASIRQSQAGQPHSTPTAPSVYRPEPRKIVQPKMAAPAHTPPKAPPVYRPPSTPRALQKKDKQTKASPGQYNSATLHARQRPVQEPGRLAEQRGENPSSRGVDVIRNGAPRGLRPSVSSSVVRQHAGVQPKMASAHATLQAKVSGAARAVIQPLWKEMKGLKKGQGYWESQNDGDAPTGVYKKVGESGRWKNDESKQIYLETEDGKLNKEPKPSDPIEGKSDDYHTKYETALRDAMKTLLKHTRFGGSNDQRRYDQRYWTTGKDKDGDEILILTSGQPADAVNAIFASPRLWSFDCIEIIQVGRWYAELTAMGADEFNKKDKGSFKLSYHETTGLRGRTLYRRERKRDNFTSIDGLTGRKTATDVKLTTAQEEDAFLRTLPIGTRVMWSDSHEDAFDTDFENENTIKVGDDRYAAHPFGTLSAAKMRAELGPSSSDEPSRDKREAYIRRHVFIKEIEWNARS